MKKRFREDQLKAMYHSRNLKGFFILWVDFDVLFPYCYTAAEVTISLNGKNIVHEISDQQDHKILVKDKKVRLEKNGEKGVWFESVLKKGTEGVPFFFRDFASIQAVETVNCTCVLHYGQSEETIVYVAKRVRIEHVSNEGKDYCIHLDGTVIPSLMEEKAADERKHIISSYDEVILANTKVDKGSHFIIPIYSNVIRSVSNIPGEQVSGAITNLTHSIVRENNIKECSSLTLNVFLGNDIILLHPETVADDGIIDLINLFHS